MDRAESAEHAEMSSVAATAAADPVSTFVQEFGWVLTDVAGENPERISDPKYHADSQ